MTREEQIREAARRHDYDDVVFGEIFAEGARWADANPAWVSVEDELPPKKSEYDSLSNNVLATDGKEIYESVYNHDFEEWFTHDLWAINNITHWMPFPIPPSESVTTCNHKTSSSSEISNNHKKGEQQ